MNASVKASSSRRVCSFSPRPPAGPRATSRETGGAVGASADQPGATVEPEGRPGKATLPGIALPDDPGLARMAPEPPGPVTTPPGDPAEPPGPNSAARFTSPQGMVCCRSGPDEDGAGGGVGCSSSISRATWMYSNPTFKRDVSVSGVATFLTSRAPSKT